ncbi:MAG: NDP-sugar synthase [Candidatus Bipolaricaulis sp.]|nr:NDP-sugar synthase [Candidatus Bipolaricaulis sp.]
MRALVLAAGRGERLRPLTDKTPKPLIEVAGKPVLEHVLDHLAGYGITEVIVNVHYKAEQIIKRFGNRALFSYESELLGTAGAMRKVKDWLGREFLVVNGDTLTNVDLNQFIGRFGLDSEQGGVFTLDTDVHNGGTYIFNGSVFEYIPNDRPYSLHEDLIPFLKATGKEIMIYKPEGVYYFDCGTPEKLEKARKFYEKKLNNLSSL